MRPRHSVRNYLIVSAVAAAAFIGCAGLGLRGSDAAAPASDRMPGTVTTLKIHSESRGKPSWICPDPGPRPAKPCQKIAYVYPLRFEACITDIGTTTCWYTDAAVFGLLTPHKPVPAKVHPDAFTDPHSKPSPGRPTSFKVVATKPNPGRKTR